MGQHIRPFLFEGEHLVRVIEESGALWFVAKDVASAIAIVWKGDGTLARIPDRWKLVRSFGTSFGDKETIFISEPAVYKLAFRSNKPEAERFTNWVAGDVLPSIRQTGSYSIEGEVIPPAPAEHRPFPDWPLEEMRTKKGVVDMYRLLYGCMAAQWISPQMGFPPPPPELVEHGRQYTMTLVPVEAGE